MSRSQRLPGIAFVAEPPQPAATLPRMDIAGFVGFAATGPLDRPVVLEDEARFREVFGPDLPLAWDSASGSFNHSLLGPSVRAFFRNGGRRCWVVRVAGRGEQAPKVQYLPLPGLLHMQAKGAVPATLRARSAGSWGDGLEAVCVLRTESLTVRENGVSGLGVSQGVAGRLAVGDLVRLWYPDGSMEFAPIDAMEGRGDSLWLDTPRRFRFTPVTGEVAVEALHLVDDHGSTVAVSVASEPGVPANDDSFGLVLDLPPGAAVPQRGMLLPSRDSGEAKLVLQVAEVTSEASAGSPLPDRIRLGISAVWREEDVATDHAESPLYGQRLSLELEARHVGEQGKWRLDGLGFVDGHPRAWHRLPTDETLFPLPDDPNPVSTHDLADLVDHPRFPLAGTGKTGIILPLGLGDSPSPVGKALGDTDRLTTLMRDGLASIDEHLFYDKALDPARAAGSLGALAYHQRFELEQPLQGLHSLYFLDEVTLLSTPDAVQRGWEAVPPVDPAADLLLPPPRLSHRRLPEEGMHGFTWSAVSGASTYRLQVALDPLFESLDMQSVTVGLESRPGLPASCTGWRWVRVRAEHGARFGPWSNTSMFLVPSSDFEADTSRPPSAPEAFAIETLSGDRHRLSWAGKEGVEAYVLEEAGMPDFSDGHELLCSADTAFELLRPIHQASYFRVRCMAPASPWSVTLWMLPQPGRSFQMLAPDPQGPPWLLGVHEAMLHTAAARADLFATLTLPQQLRAGDVVQYLERLSGRFPDPQDHTLSFGALYHPWVLSSPGAQGDGWTSPDGLAVGVQAARALSRGAWVAPANMPFSDVLGLMPEMDDDEWSRLHSAQVNLVRRHPRGFLCLSSNTLSREDQLLPINVRRLLILLRRLALREGQALVFEPNDESLRRRVKRLFDSLLDQLYERGAFAGRRPEEAYQVVTDDSVNPPSGIDRGRLLVELRVAPSQPLEFLTVRLVQYGNGDLRLEGS